jgi:PKHD-type hydroxylase
MIMNNPVTSTWYLNLKHCPTWSWMDNVFTKEECEKIKELGDRLEKESALVSGKDLVFNENTEYRKNLVSWFNSSDPDTTWIFERCTGAVIDLNAKFWNFDLDYIEVLQYSIYDKIDDHYLEHIDTLATGIHYRKLSFSIQLDDPDTYDGCDLQFRIHSYPEQERTPRRQGTMVAFPSYTLHEVTPLTRGKRRSLVGWVCGPNFK